jgi:hypothetical protein
MVTSGEGTGKAKCGACAIAAHEPTAIIVSARLTDMNMGSSIVFSLLK